MRTKSVCCCRSRDLSSSSSSSSLSSSTPENSSPLLPPSGQPVNGSCSCEGRQKNGSIIGSTHELVWHIRLLFYVVRKIVLWERNVEVRLGLKVRVTWSRHQVSFLPTRSWKHHDWRAAAPDQHRSILTEAARGRRPLLVFVRLGRFGGHAVAAARRHFAAPYWGKLHLPGPALHSQTSTSFGLINDL